MDEQSSKTEEEVISEGIDWEIEELVPEWGSQRDKGQGNGTGSDQSTEKCSVHDKV